MAACFGISGIELTISSDPDIVQKFKPIVRIPNNLGTMNLEL
jgi:hypothetical protein